MRGNAVAVYVDYVYLALQRCPFVLDVDLVGRGTKPVKEQFYEMSSWARVYLADTHFFSHVGNSEYQYAKDTHILYKEHSVWRFTTEEDRMLFQLRWAGSGCIIATRS
jgi:hypothetical protein